MNLRLTFVSSSILFCREWGCSARLQLPAEDVSRGVREPPQRPQERADLLLQVPLSSVPIISQTIFTFLAKVLFQEVKFWVCFNVGSRKYKIWQNCSVWGWPLSYEWPVVTHRFSAATTSATSWARPRHRVPRPHSPSRCCFCYAFLLLTSDGYLLYIIVNCIQTNWTINCHINWTVSSLCSWCIKFPEFQVTPGNLQTGIVSILCMC